MNYEASKQLTDARFKRLVGVQRTTFEEMLAVLKTAYQLKHAKGGRKPKLSLEDLLMATLQYVREYRTYEEIAADFGIHESNLIRRSQWVEVTLVQSGVTISRTKVVVVRLEKPVTFHNMIAPDKEVEVSLLFFIINNSSSSQTNILAQLMDFFTGNGHLEDLSKISEPEKLYAYIAEATA
ncbi:transposase-like protein%2C IS1381 ISSpn7 [Streptococcus pneumoniae]|nr:transposase-like protein%2C IS1381 ISSpn7 [Streptococcus pneumoniae]